MMTVVVGLKASSGVTTFAITRAYRQQATVVEADPAGGDVAGWWGCPDGGLSDLAAAALRQGEIRPEQVTRCAWVSTFGVPAVTAPLLAQGTGGSVAAVVDVLPKLATEMPLVVDAGEADPQATTGRLLAHADTVVLLVPAVVGELARLRALLPEMRQMCQDRLKVVLSQAVPGGPMRYGPGEVARTLSYPVAGVAPFDPRTAAVVAGWPGRLPGRRPTTRWWRWRWPLLEAVTRI